MSQLSVVSPAYNEADNLPEMHQRLRETLDGAGVEWEWVVVDDHSGDETFAVLTRLAMADGRVRGLRLARNSGSHTAIRCAIRHAHGEAIALLASDLEDPPEVLLRMLAEWKQGAQVVWAVRGVRGGVRTVDSTFARIYYWMMRRLAGLALPPTGADCFLIDRVVGDVLDRCGERHTSLFALLTWLGFRQTHVIYDKGVRPRGTTGWTLRKKVRLVVDSLVGFSDVLLTWLLVAVLLTAVGAIVAAALTTTESPLNPWTVLAVSLVLAAMQLMGLWAVGQYLWRALDEARARPLWAIEASTFDVRTRERTPADR